MHLPRFQPTHAAQVRIQFGEPVPHGFRKLEADEEAFHAHALKLPRLQRCGNIVGRFICGGLFEGEGEQRADEAERCACQKWCVAVLRDRLSQIERKQPAAEQRAE